MAAARTGGISPALISKRSPAGEAQSGFCVEICLHCRDIRFKRRLAGPFIFSHTLHPTQTHVHSVIAVTQWAAGESWRVVVDSAKFLCGSMLLFRRAQHIQEAQIFGITMKSTRLNIFLHQRFKLQHLMGESCAL